MRSISLGALIVSLVSDRAYRPRRTAAEAIAELHQCSGAQFDPAVVAAFEAALAQRGAVSPAAAL